MVEYRACVWSRTSPTQISAVLLHRSSACLDLIDEQGTRVFSVCLTFCSVFVVKKLMECIAMAGGWTI